MEQTVKELMASVSRELDSLASLTSTLQEQLSPRGYEGLDIEAFQSLDALTQTLSCLATFLTRIQTAVPCTCSIAAGAALSEICLSALAARLQGAADGEGATSLASCELF